MDIVIKHNKIMSLGVLLSVVALSACATPKHAAPRAASVYDTTGFGETKQDASAHAVRNAQATCGDLSVNVVSDAFNETQYQDKTNTLYEVNMRYRCGG